MSESTGDRRGKNGDFGLLERNELIDARMPECRKLPFADRRTFEQTPTDKKL
jgi:hypothetical protein